MVGALMVAVGLMVAFGFGVGTCADGPTASTCTSGLMPQAVVIGLIVVAAGAFVAYRGVTRHRR